LAYARVLLTALPLFLAACGDDGGPSGSTELVCGEGTSGPLSAGAAVEVSGEAAEDLAGAAVAAESATTVPGEPVAIACADDIVPDGFIALGPAVTFGPVGSWSDRPFTVTLPYKAARLPEGAERRHVRIVARRHVGDGTSFFPPVSNRSIDDADPYASRVSFRAGELTTYQAVARQDAGQPVERRYTYRAIVGISMGGNAALSIGLRNHERFDLIGNLGGEPGPSMKYSLDMIREYLFGGFCTAAHAEAGAGELGELCLDQQRPLMSEQFELGSDYEHMLYQSGEGVGLTLNRNLYMKASRDLARALGNPAHYNPDHPYRPPGVTEEFLAQDAAERCGNPLVLEDFYDREFNPDGSHPVITFCDGGDSPDLGLGVFDPSLAQTNPAEIFLAVDLNGNGVRDAGEPVVINAYEPFEDVGSDGVASADEPGYDPVSNPDPNGDDYHYLRNPLGTEGNWHRDEGEPFEDVGIDGIAGTCQHGDDPGALGGCYDYGEGDGEWTLSPNVANWYASDLSVLYQNMTAAERDRVDLWMDAGIRDFLNAAVSANVGMGVLMAEYGRQGAVFDGFGALTGVRLDAEYDFARVPWPDIPRNVYVRYGNPDATESQIQNGDGRHVGTAFQVINRATSAFAWISHWWPTGDRESIQSAGQILDGLTYTAPSTGRETPFALFLPPGYDKPENADVRYPVVYFLHGYGQEPDDLVAISAVFENYMVNPSWEPEQRFQKFIIVYVDGRCRPTRDGVPVDPTGDGCERGTFYMDSPLGGPALMETNMLELMDYIDATYRTKQAETVEIVP
jgi:S-formylglutathione hydrolase FrmB